MADAKRIHPLADRLYGGNGVSLAPLPPLERISLRAGKDAVVPLGKALGVTLPVEPGKTQTTKGVSALWIGPDEWIVIAKSGADLVGRVNKVKKHLYSVVSIDHRNTAISLSGINAENALNGGCPRDLSVAAFPVGTCSRTILGKAEIILWRKGKNEFHVECWRSFSDYVWKFLADSARSA